MTYPLVFVLSRLLDFCFSVNAYYGWFLNQMWSFGMV